MAKNNFNVKALVNIKHDGVEYKENDEFILSEQVSNELQERGYIEITSEVEEDDDNPTGATIPDKSKNSNEVGKTDKK